MRRLIIDTDAGVDDALAILLALAWPDVQVEAITTAHGNVPVETATRNVFEILRIAAAEVPVARGAGAPLAGSCISASEVHGSDGLGGWTILEPPSAVYPVDAPAPALLTSLARRSPGALTLVTIGPLTNAALAARQDPEAFHMLKEIVTMGGVVEGPGNITAVAEFNIFADPEAARVVFTAGVPLILVGLDVTRKAMLTRERLEQSLGTRTDRRARFLRTICSQTFSFYRNALGVDALCLHDPLAVAVALDRSLVKTQPMRADVETSGELTRGMVVAERRPWAAATANIEVCTDVDSCRFLDTFSEKVLSCPPLDIASAIPPRRSE